MAQLALIRHGESEWNAKNLECGWADVPLSEKGKTEAKLAAQNIKDDHWDVAFVSVLERSEETLDIIKKILDYHIPTISDKALNERDYGDYTGRNKAELEKELGKVELHGLRRGWNFPIPHGETLKDVYTRVVPYFKKVILPQLEKGKNVLVSAHGNSLRALVKYIDGISDKDIEYFELPTGKVRLYSFENGKLELVHP